MPLKADLTKTEAEEQILLRLPNVLNMISIGRSTFLAGVKAGRFPAPIYIGHIPLWRKSEICQFIESL